MTTTEQTAEPVAHWERAYVRDNWVPPITEATATDADYLTTRLRMALAHAERMAAEPGTHDIVQGVRLRIEIERLIDELGVFGRAGTELLGTLRRLCPGISWERSYGEITGTASAWALVDPVEPSARQLRLRQGDKAGHWSGVIEGVTIELRGSSIPGAVERVRGQIGDDVADFLHAAGPDLPPIPWHRVGRGVSGHAIDYPGIDEHTVAGRWAAALGITDLTQRADGLGEYAGETAIGRVSLSWVWDQARWDACVAEVRERLG